MSRSTGTARTPATAVPRRHPTVVRPVATLPSQGYNTCFLGGSAPFPGASRRTAQTKSKMDAASLVEYRRPWLADIEIRPGTTRRFTRIDPAMLARIVAAYRAANRAERDRGVLRDGPWRQIRAEHMGELVHLLERGEPAALDAYLGDLPVKSAGHGFFQGKASTCSDPEWVRRRLIWMMDSVCGLAEALGVLAVECPERERAGGMPHPTVPTLVAAVEQAAGISITVPDVCAGLVGVAVENRVVHVRSACAVSVALRIAGWLGERTGARLAESRICEIGPGIGLAASSLAALGARRMCLVDLPEMNAVQAFFLAQALPGHRLVLHGEPCPGDEPAIRIMPDFEFLAEPLPRFDLVLNQDSLPEMDLATVHRYLARIPEVTDAFLSINQETQIPSGAPGEGGFLPSLRDVSAALRPVSRQPFWVRHGYVEEIFRCAPGAG